jgi:hypothetical protein
MSTLFGHKKKGPHLVTEVDVETGKMRKVSVKPMTKEQRQAYIDKHRKTKKGGRRGTRRTRRRTSTIRMKKSTYLREHHHLFKVLQNPTRRALNAELRDQKRELARRGLKE